MKLFNYIAILAIALLLAGCTGSSSKDVRTVEEACPSDIIIPVDLKVTPYNHEDYDYKISKAQVKRIDWGSWEPDFDFATDSVDDINCRFGEEEGENAKHLYCGSSAGFEKIEKSIVDEDGEVAEKLKRYVGINLVPDEDGFKVGSWYLRDNMFGDPICATQL